MSLCVYALSSPAIGRIAGTGIAGERLRAVAIGAVVAIVGETPRLPRPTEANLRQYDRLIQRLSRRAPALLPARYGTRVRDLYELALIVGSRQAVLRRRLKAVRNRVQMTVRVLTSSTSDKLVARTFQVRAGEPEGGVPIAPARWGAVARPTRRTHSESQSGADYLRARARAAALANEIPPFTPLRDAVRRWIRAERVEKRGAIATVYHLVPRGAVPAYRQALEKKARDTGIRVMITGPWPAYAFADPTLS